MSGQLLSRIALISCMSGVAVLAHSTINYTVEPKLADDPANSVLHVSVSFTSDTTFTDIQAPNWSPGSYRLQEMSRNMKGVSATAGDGKSIEIHQTNDYTWSLIATPGTKVTFEYDVPARISDGAINYAGPSTYVYLVGRKMEDCQLSLKLPDPWLVATGLEPVRGKRSVYTAPTYDVLADCPVSLGDLVIDIYVSHGKKHYIAMRGAAKAFVDRDYLIRVCKAVSDYEGDYFGGFPFTHYVWHFAVNDRIDGAGGLEHLNSTQISMAAGMGFGTIGVYSHEYFHLWNVKRIRSSVLGPFDYTQLPKTGALWWLEGVTDYFAHLLPTRYNLFDDQEFYRQLVNNYNSVQNNPAHLEVGPNEASMRVGEASNGRGNSNGYRISYYNFGFITGFCLDVQIRSLTNGKRSLDDVEHALWDMCKNDQPGFQEDAIRTLCIKYGGPSMGDYYDRVVMKGGDSPVPEQLAKLGLEIKDVDDEVKDLGFSWTPSPADKAVRVTNPRAEMRDSLPNGSMILSINGTPTCGDTTRSGVMNMNKIIDAAKEGDKLTMQVKTDSGTSTVTATVQVRKRTLKKIVEMANATPEQLALRAGLLYGKAGKPGVLFDHSK